MIQCGHEVHINHSPLVAAHASIVMQKSATLLRDLLDSNHIVEYITTNSCGGSKGKSRAPPITWSSLFRSVVDYVSREGEAILKLEEKSGQSSSSLKAKKKVSSLSLSLSPPFSSFLSSFPFYLITPIPSEDCDIVQVCVCDI